MIRHHLNYNYTPIFFFPFNGIDINCQYNGKIENLFIFKYKLNYKFPQFGGIKNDKPPNPL